MTGRGTRTIRVDTLARVEGEGSLYIKLVGDRVADVKLKIYEPPDCSKPFCADVTSLKRPTSRREFVASVPSLTR